MKINIYDERKPSTACYIDFFREIINFIKIVGLFIGAVAVFITALMLWYYLISIGAEDLFFSSIISLQGLTALFLAGLFFTVLIIIGNCAPSVLMLITSTMFKDPQALKILLKLFFLVSIVALASFFWLVDFNINFSLLFIIILIVILVGLIDKTEDNHNYSILNNTINGKESWIILICYLFLSCIATLLFLGSLSKIWIISRSDSLDLSLFTIIFIIGHLPGYFYLMAKSTRNKLSDSVYALVSGTTIVIVFILFAAPLNIKAFIYQKTGLYSLNKQHFQLLNTKLVESMKMAGLIEAEDNTKYPLFTAYTKYNFGGIRLLCKNPLGSMDDKQSVHPDGCLALKDEEVKHIYLLDKKANL